MATKTVGVREFRERLAEFLDGSQSVAITRHGEPIGIYIPTPRPKNADKHLAALRKAAEKVDAMLAEAGISEERLIRDFDEDRQRRPRAR